MNKTYINLANRYSLLSLIKNPLSLIPFIYDLYHHKKITEATSFLVWELFHQLKIFKPSDYINFEKEVIFFEGTENVFNNFDNVNRILFFNVNIKIEKISNGWKNVFVHVDDTTAEKVYWGSLVAEPRKLYKKDISCSEKYCFIIEFENEITCVFISSKNTIFVCTKGIIYTSNDNGKSFQKSLLLSNSNSFILPFTGITETSFGTVVLGEYASIWDLKKSSWLRLPYLHYTCDRGLNWKRLDFLIAKGINKHVHIIRYCKFLNKLILTDGDNKKKLWISEPIISADIEKIKWNLFNRFHIGMGGHTSIVESDEKILFGTDYLGGTNFIIETSDLVKMKKYIIPDPYRRNLVESIIRIKTIEQEQVWLNLKSSIIGSKCLIAFTINGGKTWNKCIEYDGSLFNIIFCCSSNKDLPEFYFNIEDNQSGKTTSYRINLK